MSPDPESAVGRQRVRRALVESTVRHSIRGSADWVDLSRTTVEGNVTIDTDDYNLIGESTVLGWVTVRHGGLTVEWSSIGKGLSTHLTWGVNVCGSDIDGDVTISHATRVVGIGANPDGLGECYVRLPSAGTPRAGLPPAQRDAVTIGGTLTLRDIPHTVFLDNTTVGTDLVCSGNSGPRGLIIGEITVAGTRLGQCA